MYIRVHVSNVCYMYKCIKAIAYKYENMPANYCKPINSERLRFKKATPTILEEKVVGLALNALTGKILW